MERWFEKADPDFPRLIRLNILNGLKGQHLRPHNPAEDNKQTNLQMVWSIPFDYIHLDPSTSIYVYKHPFTQNCCRKSLG